MPRFKKKKPKIKYKKQKIPKHYGNRFDTHFEKNSNISVMLIGVIIILMCLIIMVIMYESKGG